MKFLKKEWFSVLIAIGFWLVTWLWYDDLPAKVPTHWNIRGQIDNWTTPNGHVLMFGGLLLGMYLLLTLIPLLEPRKENMQKSLGFLHMIKITLLAFFLGLYTVISYMAVQGVDLAIDKFISIGLGVLFVVIGNYMTQIKSNYFMGIRTPWTLSSDIIWQKTHRLGAYTFTISGLSFILSALLPNPLNFILPMTITIAGALVPVVYSYHLFVASKK